MKTKINKLMVLSTVVILSGICIVKNANSIVSWFKPYEYVLEFNGNIRLAFLKNGNEVLLDSLGQRISPVVDNFFDYDAKDSLVVYRKDNYRGYYNVITKKDQLPSSEKRFKKAWNFDVQSGLAAVLDAQSNKIGFINRTGQYVIKPQFIYDSEYDYVFSDGECIVSDSLDTYKVINTKGENKFGNMCFSTIEIPFRGIRVVSDLNGKYGLLTNTAILLPCEYDQIDLTEDEIFFTKDAHKWGVDYNLKIKSPMVFDDVVNLCFKSSEDEDYLATRKNIASSRYSVINVNYMYGLYDNQTKKVVVPAVYEDIYALGTTKNLTIWGSKNDVVYPMSFR